MEVCFDLLIPKIPSDDSFLFLEEKIEWGGEFLSQDPQKFCWKNQIVFCRREPPTHILSLVTPNLDVSGWEYLTLETDAIERWEASINSSSAEDELEEIFLKVFLSNLLPRLDSWVVVFEYNCDQIDNIYKLNLDELILKVESILDWKNNPEGFIAWHE